MINEVHDLSTEFSHSEDGGEGFWIWGLRDLWGETKNESFIKRIGMTRRRCRRCNDKTAHDFPDGSTLSISISLSFLLFSNFHFLNRPREDSLHCRR